MGAAFGAIVFSHAQQICPREVHLLIRMEPIVACAGDVTEKQSFS
jgi:hypothetical protein